MRIIRGIQLLLWTILAACAGPEAASIAQQFAESGGESVDLSTAVPGAWDRLCILGPYSGDTRAAATLGFEWPAEALTEIEDSDGISLLIFVQADSVLKFVEHPRGSGDFSNLSGRCFSRSSAVFKHVARPPSGWAGLFPADEL